MRALSIQGGGKTITQLEDMDVARSDGSEMNI